MAQKTRVNGLEGYFDCREYNPGKEKEQRIMKSQTATIKFSAYFAEQPEGIRVKQTSTGKLKADFKIGASTRWVDEYGQQQPGRPAHELLESGRFKVNAVFVDLPKDPSNPMKASGYWIDEIQFSKVSASEFEGCAMVAQPQQPAPQPQPAPQAAQTSATNLFPEDDEVDIPF